MIFTGMDTPLSIQQLAQPRTIYIEWNARAFVAAHHCGCHGRGSSPKIVWHIPCVNKAVFRVRSYSIHPNERDVD